MNQFVNAISQPQAARTTNGMAALDKTGSKLVDFFFQAAAMRGRDATANFVAAMQEDKLLATKMLFWLRDVRGGAGERQQFRNCLKWLANDQPEVVRENLDLVVEFGRFDDLFSIEHPRVRKEAMEFWAIALRNGNALAAKWVPRSEKKNREIREAMGMTPRNFRKFVSELTNVVETAMCSGKWDTIEFGKLPSVASARYQKAFGRHAQEQYAKYIDGLQKGTEKINASSIFPHDVIHSMRHGDRAVAIEQWKALPNFMGDQKVLALVDVSGSMDCPLNFNRGKYGGPTCMDVAVALGLYVADKLTGAFKDTFLTFTSSPQLLHLKGDVGTKMDQMIRAEWHGSTNLEAALLKILDHATANKVPNEDMPTMLVILSDMNFNCCSNAGSKAIDMVRAQYANKNRPMPSVVFWNINAANHVPVSASEGGVALVSGFSPSIFKALLASDMESFTPYGIMMQTLNSERYNRVVV